MMDMPGISENKKIPRTIAKTGSKSVKIDAF